MTGEVGNEILLLSPRKWGTLITYAKIESYLHVIHDSPRPLRPNKSWSVEDGQNLDFREMAKYKIVDVVIYGYSLLATIITVFIYLFQREFLLIPLKRS